MTDRVKNVAELRKKNYIWRAYNEENDIEDI
jgi:hypothetical protein